MQYGSSLGSGGRVTIPVRQISFASPLSVTLNDAFEMTPKRFRITSRGGNAVTEMEIAMYGLGFPEIGLLVLLMVPVIWSVIWAYGDAERRGKSGCLVALMVFLVTWPAGLIIWLVFRPERKPDA